MAKSKNRCFWIWRWLQHKSMKCERDLMPTLPFDIIQLVLSFLSVPELLRMRVVCKEWKECISHPSFQNLCNKNGKSHMYLIMSTSLTFQDTLHFLDLNARLWYSIPPAQLHRANDHGHGHRAGYHAHGVICWNKSTNNGLIYELIENTAINSSEFNLSLAISDPIAKRRMVLPIPPSIFVHSITSLRNLASSMEFVLAVDQATGIYKVLLLNNHACIPRMYIHDSSTRKWRPLQNLPNGITGSWASSAVVLHDSVFILKHHIGAQYRLSLFQYKFMDETWTEPYHMYFSRNLDECCLLVSGDRLFLDVVMGYFLFPEGQDPGLRTDPDCRGEGESFRSSTYPAKCYEIYEVLVGERRKLVAQFTEAQLQQIFGGQGGSVGWNRVPCVDSDGICRSIILGSRRYSRGVRLRRYHLATGSVDTLPPHPMLNRPPVLRGSYYPMVNQSRVFPGNYNSVEDMKLSLRDLLAPAPDEQTSKG